MTGIRDFEIVEPDCTYLAVAFQDFTYTNDTAMLRIEDHADPNTLWTGLAVYQVTGPGCAGLVELGDSLLMSATVYQVTPAITIVKEP